MHQTASRDIQKCCNVIIIAMTNGRPLAFLFLRTKASHIQRLFHLTSFSC